ncbi:MAG: hypothetical protein ACRDH9_10470 [Actinomycetota bacterium]
MRRATTVLVLVAALVAAGTDAGAHHKWKRCGRHIDRADKEQVAWAIRCAARELGTVGGPQKAVAVASCESGLRYDAVSPGGGHVGLFQHITSKWPIRAALYGFRGSSWKNVRAMVWVSLRMVARQGSWAGWSCA